jgi:acyl-CoA dehydrogenase
MSVSEHHSLLVETVDRMLADRCTPEVVTSAEGGYAAELWQTFEQAGLTLVAVPEHAGGGGAGLHDAMAVVRCAARHAAPLPLPETGLLAGFALAEAGLDVPSGPLTCAWTMPGGALELRRRAGGWTLSGVAPWVPFARVASRVVAVANGRDGDHVVSVDPARAAIVPRASLAGEPRDELCFVDVAVGDADVAPAPPSTRPAQLELRAALCRAVQLAGGLERALELSVAYAGERVQFGRPIGRFQAVQGLLAELAAEAAAGAAAADEAVDAVAAVGLPDAEQEVAVAKLRTSEAAGRAARAAHQIHGAIGTTREHRLHLVTRRLWSWRDEHGNEAEWAAWLGERVVAAGADALWPGVTAPIDRSARR